MIELRRAIATAYEYHLIRQRGLRRGIDIGAPRRERAFDPVFRASVERLLRLPPDQVSFIVELDRLLPA